MFFYPWYPAMMLASEREQRHRLATLEKLAYGGAGAAAEG